MSNPNNPFGFRWCRNLSGGAPTYQLFTAYILSSYATPIFRGDVVVWASGYINLATPGTTTIAGVFDGCEYQSQSLKQPRWSPYWPGSDAPSGGTLKCYIITDPYAVFQCQTDGTSAVGVAATDQNANFVAGAGDTSTGNSTMALSHSYTTTPTLPFRIVNVGGPANQYLGTDNTSPYNIVEVVFNNAMLRNTTAV